MSDNDKSKSIWSSILGYFGYVKPEVEQAVLREDERRLSILGYNQELSREMSSFDNWATSMGALYFLGGIQVLFATGLQSGGPLALWTNWIIASVLTIIMACSLAETCSAYPTAGSIYYWAFKCSGKKWGPLLSWVTAWLNVTSWITNVASDSTAGAEFIMNEPLAFNITSFDIDTDDVLPRVVQFGIASGILLIGTCLNLMNPRYFSILYKLMTIFIVVSFFMNLIWLPVGVSRTYGFQNVSTVFLSTANYNQGTSLGTSWMLGFLLPMYTLVGFDASGHVAEETKSSHTESPRGIVSSCATSALLSFPVLIMFLFCIPGDVNSFLNSNYSQPIVGMFQLAVGSQGQAWFIGVCVFLWVLNATITLQATSRIVYAIARDHVLPFSKYLRTRNRYNQPFAAILFSSFVAFIMIMTILPSSVAFESITSGSVVACVASYTIVIFGRVVFTSKTFVQGEWNLGKLSMPFSIIAIIYGVFISVVLCLPTSYPVTTMTFNYASIILGCILVLCFSHWAISARHWFKGPMCEVEKPELDGTSQSIDSRVETELRI